MFGYELDRMWIADNIFEIGFWFVTIRAFLNAMLERMPTLKSNKIFDLVCNVMDSIVAVAKERFPGGKNEIYNLSKRDIVDPDTK